MDSNNTPFESTKSEIFDSFDVDENKISKTRKKKRKDSDKSKNKRLKTNFAESQENIEFDVDANIDASNNQKEKNSKKKKLNQQNKKKLFDDEMKIQNEYWGNDETSANTLAEVNYQNNKHYIENNQSSNIDFTNNDCNFNLEKRNISENIKTKQSNKDKASKTMNFSHFNAVDDEKSIRNSLISSVTDMDSDNTAILKKGGSNKKRQKLIRNAKLLSETNKTNEYFQQNDIANNEYVDVTNSYPLNSKTSKNSYQKINFDNDEAISENNSETNFSESVKKGKSIENISSKHHSVYEHNTTVENETKDIDNYQNSINSKKSKISARQKRAMLNKSKQHKSTLESNPDNSGYFKSAKGFESNTATKVLNGYETVKSGIKTELQEELFESESDSNSVLKQRQRKSVFGSNIDNSEHFKSDKGFKNNTATEVLSDYETVKSGINTELQEELVASEGSSNSVLKQSKRKSLFENNSDNSKHFRSAKGFESNTATTDKFLSDNDIKSFERVTSDIAIKNELINKKTMAEEINNSAVTDNSDKIESGKLSSRQKRALLNKAQNNRKKNIYDEKDKLSESSKSQKSDSDNSELNNNKKKGIQDILEKEEKSNIKSSLLNLENSKLSKEIILKSSKKASNLTNKSLDDNETLDDDMYNQASSLSKELGNKGIKNALDKTSGFSNKSPLSEELNNNSDNNSARQDFSKIRKKIANIVYKNKFNNMSSSSMAEDAAKKSVARKAAVEAERKFIAGLAKAAASEPHIAAGAVIILVVIVLLLALFSSCSVMVSSVGNGIISTTYMTDEKEIYDASVYYTKLEADYQAEINKKIKTSEKSGDYDEVRYNIDSFNHNPEVLISYLSAQYPGWSFDLDLKTWFTDLLVGLDYNTVKDVEKDLLKKQYKLEETEYWEWHYPSAHAMFPVRWYVKEYTLVNNDLETVVNERMDADTKEYYDLLREYRGNRPWFGSPVDYDWSTVVANLCGYTLKGSTSFSKYSSTSSLTYQADGSTVSAGTSITLPEGLGKYLTYMGWQTITSTSSAQYKLREQAGMNFDAEGFGIINNRYVVAVTSTFGSVGDYIDVYQSDGTVFPCIIGDIKNQNDLGCNKWGHQDGEVVLEFVVDKNSWYGGHANPGTQGCHPEWGGKSIIKIANIGTYQEGEPAPNGGIEEGIISSSQLVDDLETDVTPHKGIDIAGTSQTKVYAIFDGVVVTKTSNTVSIKSTDEEYQVIYDSITDIIVAEGQEVKTGDEIGTMTDKEILRNNSGGYINESSLGVPHLHLEIRSISENQQYNPYFYIAFGSGDAPQIIVSGNNAVGDMVAGDSETGNRVVELALSRVGYMYLWGGGHSEAEIRNPNSTRFDCSGLVCWAFCQAGSYIGVHNTTSLATMGKPIEYSRMQAGDIILWSSNGALSGVHHVAIYIGGGQIVEAPYDGQPISTRPVYDKNQIYTIRRLYND